MIERLEHEAFRNLEASVLEPAAGVHLLLGGTGQGKTSVLEAIYILATTRSFRTSRLADCVRSSARRAEEGPPPKRFRLLAEIEVGRRSALEVSWSPEGLLRRVNGESSSLAEHLGQLPVLAWTAADVEIIAGPPEARRRLLDRIVVTRVPSALERLTRYRRALEHKRRLLASGDRGLDAWNEVLADAAGEIVGRRREASAALERALNQLLVEAHLDLPSIELRYRPSPAIGSAEQNPTAAIAEALAKIKGEERRRRQVLLGPHRDGLKILWGGAEVARVASAGERKAVGLLLLAAQAQLLVEAERTPVLLLDDADTELDSRTLAALWPYLTRVPQVFVSSNREEVWSGLETGAIWRVRNGRVVPE